MTGVITFMFVCGLLFFAGLCYFGVRRDKALFSILAIFAFAALAINAPPYIMDLARQWSGREPESRSIGIEAIFAMIFVAWRHQGWIGHPRRVKHRGAMRRGIGGRHAGR